MFTFGVHCQVIATFWGYFLQVYGASKATVLGFGIGEHGADEDEGGLWRRMLLSAWWWAKTSWKTSWYHKCVQMDGGSKV